MITSQVPGRIRLRPASPLAAQTVERLLEAIRLHAPSATLQTAPASGSMLLTFQERQATPAVAAVIRDMSPAWTPKQNQTLARKNAQSTFALPSMRTVKRGMVVSLGASLALVAAGSERGHAIAGGVFTALLARHVWVYRRRLLK